MRTIYTLEEGTQAMQTQEAPLTYGQQFEVRQVLAGNSTKSKRGRKAKGNKMSTENEALNATEETTDAEQNVSTSDELVKRIQKTIFDLDTFGSVTLYKDVTLPARPSSIAEAQAHVGNSSEKLLDLIYEGLKAQVLKDASDDKKDSGKATTFSYCKEDYPLDREKNPTLGDLYTGQSASKEKKDIINSAILSMAKMFGYDSSKSAEENEKAKQQARDIIKSNPVMLKSLQG